MKIWNSIYGWLRTNQSIYELAKLNRVKLRFRKNRFGLNRALLTACTLSFLAPVYGVGNSVGNSAGNSAENEVESSDSSSATDLEFLEFLGLFETESGQWIDPDSLLSEEFGELLDAVAPDNAANGAASSDEANNGDSSSSDQPSNNQ